MTGYATTTKLFHALAGDELAKVIKDDVERLLNGSQILVPHLTFPKCSYSVEIRLESYPMDRAVIFETNGEFDSGDSKPEDRQVETLTSKREIGETQETAPDAVREAHDLPTLVTERQADTGAIIERPKMPRVTVGKGTEPRGKMTVKGKAKTQPTTGDAQEEVFLDDDGKPVVVVMRG